MKIAAFFAFGLGVLTVSGSSALAVDMAPGRDAMLREIDMIGEVFSTQYAPADWKKSYTGWDLAQQIEKAKAAVTSADQLSVADYQRILYRFFNSTRDYHVSVAFASTEAATLPLVIRGAEGRYFLAYIDRTKLPETSFPLGVGDEVIQFGGKPVGDVVTSLLPPTINTTVTDQARAELALTKRTITSNGGVPRGPIEISFKPKGSNRLVTQQLIWDYTPERIPGGKRMVPSLTKLTASMAAAPSKGISDLPLLNRQMVEEEYLDQKPTGASPFDIGGRISYVPTLGTKVWSSAEDTVFNAYLFRGDNGHIYGYIRIPSYVPEMSNSTAEKALAEFRQVVGFFQSASDGLIIDEINNPGGSVFYLYSLASMLTDQPLKTPRHKMGITASDASAAAKVLDTLKGVKDDASAKKVLGENYGGYPVTYEFAGFLKEYSEFMISQYGAGNRLTTPYWIAGVDHINPDTTTQYTKPILLLTNSLDFSGGDFFPATLQDNHRVTILGTRTAGAGGYIVEVTYPNPFGVDHFVVTGSIAERADLNPIENLGVTPDVDYSLTAADFQNGFAGYKNAILSTLSGMVSTSGKRN